MGYTLYIQVPGSGIGVDEEDATASGYLISVFWIYAF